MSPFARLLAKLLCCAWAGVALAAESGNLVVNGDFEQGLKAWKVYNANQPMASISECADAYQGKRALKVETTGRTRFEGIRAVLKELEPENIYVLSAYVKGSGYCTIFAYDGKWTYGPRTKLTHEWQKLEIRKFVTRKSVSLSIISDARYYKSPAVFYVDDVRVVKRAAKALPNIEVKPVAYEGEDFAVPGKHVRIVNDASASRGRYAQGRIKLYLASGVPCPQTARPVYLYVKAWISHHESHHLGITALNTGQGDLSLPKSKDWVWARFEKPLEPRRVGDVFHVGVSGKKKYVETRLDVLVMATRADLSTEELEAAASRTADAPERGLVKISRTPILPAIDGILTDACWRGVVAATPFAVRGQNKSARTEFPKDATRAYLCYDAKNLYVALRCFQYVLKPENNQLSAFRKNVSEHDLDAIWRDDCVLVMLDTNLDRKGFFNLMLNAAGAMLDERCPPEAPWRKRDKAWESKAQIKAHVGDGFWTVEARIPFETLGTTPKEGDLWGLGLGRINMTQGGKGEQTSWQPMEGGFHNAEEFGLLEFGSEVLGAELLELADLRPGENTVRCTVQNTHRKQANVRLGVEIADEDRKTQREFADYSIPAQEVKDVKLAYILAAEEEVGFRYYVQNPGNLSDIYRSPRYLMRVLSSTIKINVTCNSDYTVFLNGAVLGQGGKGQKSYTCPLYQGANVIALETGDKDVDVTCEVGQEKFGLDGTWRYATQRAAGWNGEDFDDSGWKRWSKADPGRDVIFLRKNLLFKQSKIWPPNGGIHVPIGATTTFWHWLDGVKGRELLGYKFCVEVPEGIELVGATAFEYLLFKGVGNVVQDIQKAGTVRNGSNYHRYVISFRIPVRPIPKRRRSAAWSHCYLGVKALKDVGEDAKLYYYMETDRFTEIPNSERIIVYPRLNSRKPKHHIFICRGHVETYGNSPALEEAVVETMSLCGFTHYSGKKEYTGKYGMKNYRSGMEWFTGLMGLNRADPKFRRFDEDGKKYTPVGWCPTLLKTKEAQEYIAQTYAKFQRATPFDVVDWDIECNPFTGRVACSCRECLARFRDFAGLPKGVTLNRKVIEGKYRDQWIAFQCRQVELTAGVLKAIIKQTNPETLFSAYSGYQYPTLGARGSADWALIGRHVDIACCGYGRTVKDIKATRDALAPHNVPLLGGILIDCPFDRMEPPHPHQTQKVEIIRRVLDCRGGVFYTQPCRGMDARSYISLAEVTRFLAEFEDFFVSRHYDPALIAETNLQEDDIVVLRKGRGVLILLMNDGEREKKARLKLAREVGRIVDYYENGSVRVTRARVVEARIPPGDFVALVCE